AGSAMVKTFSWCSPLEKTRREIETFEGEIKAARNSGQVVSSDLQVKKKYVVSDEPGKGFVSGFLTSFHHSTARSPAGSPFAGF
ncbi:MAG: hypothetical protein FWC45_05985, partial [Treponema sp.]|nr:hypothetical protein [Treponema sp.]